MGAGANKHSNSTRVRDGDNAYPHIDYKESRHTGRNAIKFIECLPIPSGSLAGEGQLIKMMVRPRILRDSSPARTSSETKSIATI